MKTIRKFSEEENRKERNLLETLEAEENERNSDSRNKTWKR